MRNLTNTVKENQFKTHTHTETERANAHLLLARHTYIVLNLFPASLIAVLFYTIIINSVFSFLPLDVGL